MNNINTFLHPYFNKSEIFKEIEKYSDSRISFTQFVFTHRNNKHVFDCFIHGKFERILKLTTFICPCCVKDLKTAQRYFKIKEELLSLFDKEYHSSLVGFVLENDIISFSYNGVVYKYPIGVIRSYKRKLKQSLYIKKSGSLGDTYYKDKMLARRKDYLENIIQKSKKLNYSLISHDIYKDMNSFTLYCQKHSHSWSPGYMNYIRSDTICTYCANELKSLNNSHSFEYFVEQARQIFGDRYIYYKEHHKNCKDDPTIIGCKIHGDFPMSRGNHINQKQGCPDCARELAKMPFTRFKESSYKHHKGKAYLYVLRCFQQEESFYKIGITSSNLKKRYCSKSDMPYQHEIISLLYLDYAYVWNLEKCLHRYFKKYRYRPEILFPGSKLECYSIPQEKLFLLKGKRFKKIFKLYPYYR